MNLKVVGNNIKQARKKKGLKQKELAEKIGKTISSIGKYELGLTQIPNDVIEQIAKVLDVSPLELLDAEEWEMSFNPNGKLAKEVKLIEQIQEVFGSESVQLLQWFSELNDQGKMKAIDDICDLTEIPKYTKGKDDI